MKPYTTSAMIFRRDLRVEDNTALNAALQSSARVIPCFILDPAQINPHPYQSKPALQFMLQSLEDLQNQFSHKNAKLQIFYASPEEVIKALHANASIEAVYCNRDYTPFSRRRDDRLHKLCQECNIDFYSYPDALLTEPEQTLKQDGSAYKVFTAFYNRARQLPVQMPDPVFEGTFADYQNAEFKSDLARFIDAELTSAKSGGRSNALSILKSLEQYQNYQQERDFPALAKTSLLSAHLKFGTCSIREAYHATQSILGPDHPLLRQFYWRDFFTHIGFHFPYVFGKAFNQAYASLNWQNDLTKFNAWVNGKTGFPIVDAGMRELNTTGFMHNRTRMIVASFLVKDLHIDWRWGERYFAQHLIDYDPAVNNGNWQWAASTGCDAQPYFRIFNPWLQQRKFDPDCIYIKRWIPELSKVSNDIVHQWVSKSFTCAYPIPIVNHDIESKIAKQQFKNHLINGSSR